MNPKINAENFMKEREDENGLVTIKDVSFELELTENGGIRMTVLDKNGQVMWYESPPWLEKQTTFTIGPFDSLQFQVKVTGV